ncbi:sensor histidine kinase [Mucilaginibacter agri]|uniref:histidine kinase n=1 Tax=Mucilaginibacter agri TaxID=2695265 RepID=A0A965ZEN2_9SPHI|nr:ATP-binding protein [Mucilaginibacter agri]NCD68594.1 GHKL domain-containing protein [Mucilaginibacter agri]
MLTAIVVQKTYTPKNNLEQTAGALERTLNEREAYVNKILANPTSFDNLKKLATDEQKALTFINEVTLKNRFWVTTILNNRLTFWSGVKVLPDSNTEIKEGRSFIRQPNGYYEAIRKTSGNFSAIFYIPVKWSYELQNKYLQNTFDESLTTDNNLELADIADKDVYYVHSIDHQYLFSVKTKPNRTNHSFYIFATILWVLSFAFLCMLIHMLCHYIAAKGKLPLAIATLAGFIIIMRFVNLGLHWPGVMLQFGLFDPQYYSAGPLLPTFGDFCVNLIMISWFAAFIYRYRYRMSLRIVRNKPVGYAIIVACVLIMLGGLTLFVNLFYAMVTASKINFDVSNVLNLSGYSLVGIIMVCLCFLIFNLIDETLLVIAQGVKVPVRHKVLLLWSGIAIATFISSLSAPFTLFYVLAGMVISIRAYVVWYKKGKLNAASFLGVLVLCALIASVKLNAFQTQREHESRKLLIKKLEASDDKTADFIFRKVEKQIITDPFLISYFENNTRNSSYLRTHFQKTYFDSYLSKYDFKIYEFDDQGKSISTDNTYILDNFKDMVVFSAFKVSDYFYRENESFGFQSYFALLPLQHNGKNLGTFVVALKSKPLQYTNSFPELLVDEQLKLTNEFKGYSFAFYSDNHLVSQSGQYVYDLVNHEFNAPLKDYSFKNTVQNNLPWYKSYTHFNHLIYKPSPRKMIVISKQEFPLLYGVTSLTFFFVLMLIFNSIIIMAKWMLERIRFITIEDNNIHWNFSVNFDRILYKTRIQFSMIFAVVVTLLMVGIISYISITAQYHEQQVNSITDRITRIASAFENHIDNQTGPLNPETQVSFNAFADAYSTDLSLFNKDGVLLYTTQPKLYQLHLLQPRMNARAYVYMSKLQKSELVNNEQLGGLKYTAGYAPIRNTKNETVAFLQLPFFSNEAEYTERIGALLNAMINIYALIFIFIGLFAILVARQITNPLSFIQHSLSKTIYGRKNEPIIWRRNDEIGSLVKEYNNMIAALEYSASRLAQSERESAWREMAKQVAHEIKNPLTPLKLGLQLLEKSWKDKDPKFDAKFERFSKSFVEQIESLSSIASEFSAFAKMPDTRMQKMDVMELLNQAVTIFKQMDNITINFYPPDEPFMIIADRDQLLRCFNNLLKNAIEAMPPGRPGLIDIDYSMEGRSILINVRDNGNGIPESLHTKIFEPNFTTKSSGTGLGLAFVKNSIENAGGRVWFETVINEGTVFHLSLPQAEAK